RNYHTPASCLEALPRRGFPCRTPGFYISRSRPLPFLQGSPALKWLGLTRRRMSLTWTAVHSPPRAVWTPLAVNARAMPRMLVMPDARMLAMIGATLDANLSASAFTAAVPRVRASARLGPPRTAPAAFF